MPSAPSQPLPDFVNRKEEMKRIRGFIEKAQRSEGHFLIIRGEPGVGKTRLIEEAAEQAHSRGFALGSGAGFSDSIVPYQPWANVLRELGLEQIMEELPPPKLLALYLLTSKSSISCKAKLKNAGAATLRTAETHLKKAGRSSLTSRASIMKEGNLTVRVLKSQRILVQQGKEFSLGAVIKGREDEAFLEDMRELIAAIESRLKKIRRSKKSRSESIEPTKELMLRFIEAEKYDGIDYARRNPELRKERLFNNIALGIARRASIKPILIILDDLQWTDPSSLSLLQYVSRNTHKSHVFILGAYRTEAGAVRSHLGTALRKIDQEDLSTELDLTGLARDHLRDLANSFLGPHDLPEDFLDPLWTETEGNPLFVREVLCRLEEEGAIKLKVRAKQLVRPVKKLDLPNRVREAIKARLKLLPKEDRELLDAAAVCGGRFTASLVARVAGEEEPKVLNGLNNIAQIHGLLQPIGYDFAFNHSTIQEVIHESLSEEARKTYHREAAEWLELAGGPIEDIAEHYYQARDKRALAMLHKAAGTAKAKYGNEEAVRFYKEALELEEDRHKRKEIYRNLGAIFSLVGSYRQSIGAYKKALELTKSKNEIAHILANIGLVHHHKGEYEESMKVCTKALGLVSGRKSKEEALALQHLGSICLAKGDFDMALDYQTRSLEITESIDDQGGMAGTLSNIGCTYMQLGEYDLALNYYKRSAKISESIGHQGFLANHLNNIGVVSYYRGNYDDAIEYYKKSLLIKEKIGHQIGAAHTLDNIGLLYRLLGNNKMALEYNKRGIAILERIGDERGLACSLSYTGLTYLAMGNLDEALKYFKQGVQLGEKIGLVTSMSDLYCNLSLGHLVKKDLNEALACCSQALSLATRIGEKQAIGEARRIIGMIQKEHEEWVEAIENFEISLKLSKEMDQKYEEAFTRYQFGLMWKAKGASNNAKEHLNKALEIFKKLKLEKEVKKVNAALKSLSTKSPSRRKPKRGIRRSSARS